MKTETWTGVVKRTASRVVSRANRYLPRGVAWMLLNAMLLSSAATSFAGGMDAGGKRGVETMTVNLYVGGFIN